MAAASVLGCCADLAGAEGVYEADWGSLKNHKTPEWFRDAKFGIYTHWGPVTVGAEDGPGGVQWYGRSMYDPQSPTSEYHRKKFGDQNKVGYKDIVPLFKAEKFDAAAWANLFAKAGAKFAGPVAIHHDNFAMWDSKYTEWDSMDKSPKRDFTGELEKAIRKRGMKFIATFHHGFAWRYFEPAYKFDGVDPGYDGLYCQPHKPGAPPTKAYLDLWLAKVNEVVQKYEPDLTWFDFGLGSVIPPEYQQRMFADYYNWAARQGREVGVAHKHRDIHQHTGILDFERGREDRLTPYAWLTDTSVGPWFHQKSVGYKSVDEIVDVLVDIVSKNGCMLLNVGPAADGTIPLDAQRILLGMGDWLRVNGEAIYSTRPWAIFGEGPTTNTGGGFSENKDKPYTGQDIRFTRSKDGRTLYVIALGWPEGELVIRSVRVDGAEPNARMQLLGYESKVDYRINDDRHLVIDVPDLPAGERPCQHAFAFKLTGLEMALHPSARFNMPGAIRIAPEKVTLEGTRVRVQDVGGRPNIGAWDNPNERCHWLVWIRDAGRYAIRGEFSSAYAPSGLKTTLCGQTHTTPIPKTQGWFKPVFVNLGEFAFERPGVYKLTLEPADPSTWRAVNVWGLGLARIE